MRKEGQELPTQNKVFRKQRDTYFKKKNELLSPGKK
jgi:hypothetical protein